MVARIVAKLVNAPRVEQTEIKPFTPEEAKAFIRDIQRNRLEATYLLAVDTGHRQARMIGFCWKVVMS